MKGTQHRQGLYRAATIKQYAWMLLTIVCFSSACAPPSREEARDTMAQVRCDRAQSCGHIGQSDGQYKTQDACFLDQQRDFNERWPADRCEGTLDEDRFEDCLKRANFMACDGAANQVDVQNFEQQCNARKLCQGSTDSNPTPSPVTQEQYKADMAKSICLRAQQCEQIGPERLFEDETTCLMQQKMTLDQLWPEMTCDDAIDDVVFDACTARALTLSCDGVASVVGALEFANQCNAQAVCTQ